MAALSNFSSTAWRRARSDVTVGVSTATTRATDAVMMAAITCPSFQPGTTFGVEGLLSGCATDLWVPRLGAHMGGGLYIRREMDEQ